MNTRKWIIITLIFILIIYYVFVNINKINNNHIEEKSYQHEFKNEIGEINEIKYKNDDNIQNVQHYEQTDLTQSKNNNAPKLRTTK